MAKTKQAPHGRTVHIDGQDFVFNPSQPPMLLKGEHWTLWAQTDVALQIAEARAATARKYGRSDEPYRAEIEGCQKLLAQLSAV